MRVNLMAKSLTVAAPSAPRMITALLNEMKSAHPGLHRLLTTKGKYLPGKGGDDNEALVQEYLWGGRRERATVSLGVKKDKDGRYSVQADFFALFLPDYVLERRFCYARAKGATLKECAAGVAKILNNPNKAWLQLHRSITSFGVGSTARGGVLEADEKFTPLFNAIKVAHKGAYALLTGPAAVLDTKGFGMSSNSSIIDNAQWMIQVEMPETMPPKKGARKYVPSYGLDFSLILVTSLEDRELDEAALVSGGGVTVEEAAKEIASQFKGLESRGLKTLASAFNMIYS